MIRKKIHYCWFGYSNKSELMVKCIDSWHKFLPDYEIKEWNETNFDVDSAPVYVKQAYDTKKWAFVSDYVRLYALYYEGGVYMDTDVEIVKPIDDLLQYKGIAGFDDDLQIQFAFVASEPKLPIIKEYLDQYNDMLFISPFGYYDLTPNVDRITDIFVKYGFIPNNKKQTIKDLTIFPAEYFTAKNSGTGAINITENTFSIHHFTKTWRDKKKKSIFNKQKILKKYYYKKNYSNEKTESYIISFCKATDSMLENDKNIYNKINFYFLKVLQNYVYAKKEVRNKVKWIIVNTFAEKSLDPKAKILLNYLEKNNIFLLRIMRIIYKEKYLNRKYKKYNFVSESLK